MLNFLKWKTADKTFLEVESERSTIMTNAYTGTIEIHGKEYHIVNGVLVDGGVE